MFGLFGHLTKAGHLGCHRLDELLLPKLRIENMELAGITQQLLKFTEVTHGGLVLAQKVEQGAHLPRALVMLPACLQQTQSLNECGCLFRRWWILWIL